MAQRKDRARLLATVLALALALAGLAGLVQPRSAQAAALAGPKAYYLALGDSLAYGYQPNFDWSHGYANDWYAMLRTLGTRNYTNYACPGETSTTFINGGCPYWYIRHTSYSGSQLSAALRFIRAHSGQVSPVSLDIGANDLLGDINASTCAVSASWSADLQQLDRNLTQTILPQFLGALTVGNIRTGDLVLMNYYNPYQNTCPNSPTYVYQLNAHLAADAAQFNIPLADVYTAFGGASAPICQYTWMCSSYHDIHATGGRTGEPGNGYAVIASAFQAATYGAPPPPPSTGTITGQVTDSSTGNPISGASVSAGGVSTSTGGTGSYSLSNVPAGSVTVTVSASGYQSAFVNNVPVTAGQTTGGVNLSLTPVTMTTGTISGTVTVRSRPSYGATVTVSGNGIMRIATTDRYGHYQFGSVAAGTYSVTATAYFGWIYKTQSVTVTGGTTTTLNFNM